MATLLLIGWLESEPWPPWYRRMVLMFQKEVAERIVAKPGTKAYGRLAVITQWRTRPRLLFTIKPEAFTPPPTVASARRRIQPIERPATGLLASRRWVASPAPLSASAARCCARA